MQITCSVSWSCATHQNRSEIEEKKGANKEEGKDRISRQYTEGERNTGDGRRQGVPQEEHLMKEW